MNELNLKRNDIFGKRTVIKIMHVLFSKHLGPLLFRRAGNVDVKVKFDSCVCTRASFLTNMSTQTFLINSIFMFPFASLRQGSCPL
jgi:hypothetical protein